MNSPYIRRHKVYAPELKPLLIFDYDGTLQETMRIYKPAVQKAVTWLRSQAVEADEPADEKISSWLGMNTDEMWNNFMPELSDELTEKAGCIIGREMNRIAASGGAAWFDGAEQMLDFLKAEDYEMVVLSNCTKAYAALHYKVFGMKKWFTDFVDCESFGNIPKSDIAKEIADIKRDIIVIGDRSSDLAAAKAVNGAFVGCVYGYGSQGELDGADELVKNPFEIAPAVKRLTDR